MNFLRIFARRVFFFAALALAVPDFGGSLFRWSTADSAAAAVVSSIKVQGNQRIEAQTVSAYLTIKAGKSFGPERHRCSIKALYDTGLFSDVSIAPRGATLVVDGRREPDHQFGGLRGQQEGQDRRRWCRSFPRSRAASRPTRELESDVNRIKEYYSRSGRNAAFVESRVTPLPNNRVDVTFYIREGDRTGVGSVTFVGNSAFSSQRLYGVIQTRKTNWLSWLSKKDVYSDEKLQADQELLRRFYLQHGYADFQVLNAEGTLRRLGRQVLRHLHGRRRARSTPSPTCTIDSSIAGVDTDALAARHPHQGRHARSTPRTSRSRSRTCRSSCRGRATCSRRCARVATATTATTPSRSPTSSTRARAPTSSASRSAATPRRATTSSAASSISPKATPSTAFCVDKAERRLRALGYFKTVSIGTEPGSAPDKVVIVVNVEDQSTGSFSIAGGVSTSDGLIAEVSLEETNFLGRGQNLRISVGGGFNSQTYNLSFTDPYFLGTRIAAGFDLYHTVENAGTRAVRHDQHRRRHPPRPADQRRFQRRAQLQARFERRRTTATPAGCAAGIEVGVLLPGRHAPDVVGGLRASPIRPSTTSSIRMRALPASSRRISPASAATRSG